MEPEGSLPSLQEPCTINNLINRVNTYPITIKGEKKKEIATIKSILKSTNMTKT
jgi:hypothetical protein